MVFADNEGSESKWLFEQLNCRSERIWSRSPGRDESLLFDISNFSRWGSFPSPIGREWIVLFDKSIDLMFTKEEYKKSIGKYFNRQWVIVNSSNSVKHFTIFDEQGTDGIMWRESKNDLRWGERVNISDGNLER